MRKNIITLLLNLFVFTVFSQAYSVDWGPEYNRQGSWCNLVGMTGENYHLLQETKRDKTLLTFNLDHKLIKNQSLNIKINRDELDFNEFIETAAGTFAVFSAYQRKQAEWQLYVSEPMENNRIGNVRLTYRHPFYIKQTLIPGPKPSFFGNWELSTNKKKVSFVNALNSNVERNKTKFVVAIFDEEMNLEWEKIQEIEHPKQSIEIEQSIVDNDGKVYVLAKIYERNTLLNLSEDIPIYKVFQITENNIESFNIELEEGAQIVDAGIFLPSNDEDLFLLSGFYTSDKRRSGLNGLFLYKKNQQNSEISSSIHPLEPSFLEGLVSRRNIEKDRGLNTTFQIDNFLLFPDGSFAFIAEEQYVSIRYDTDAYGRRTQEQITYHRDQMVIPRFSKEGELINVEKIDKDFSSSLPLAESYSLALANDKIYLLYSDAKTRGERKELGRGSVFKRTEYTDMIIIDDEGHIEFQETLFTSNETGLFFRPGEFEYRGNHLIIMASKGKVYRCGRIELD